MTPQEIIIKLPGKVKILQGMKLAQEFKVSRIVVALGSVQKLILEIKPLKDYIKSKA